MKLTVITAVYNDSRIERALTSVLSQEFEGELEVIVIDGGSTDGTLSVLAHFREHLNVFVSEPDNGAYDGMNKGIQRSTGDVIGILNADDQYADSEVLRDILTVFQNHQVDACYGDLVYVNDEDRVVRYWKSGLHRRSKWHFGWMPPHPTFFVRQSVYEQYGAFDTRFSIAADYELMLRFLVKHRIQVRYLPRVLVRMAVGGKSAGLRNIWRANASEVFEAWRRNRLRGGYLVPVLKPAQKVFQFLHRPTR